MDRPRIFLGSSVKLPGEGPPVLTGGIYLRAEADDARILDGTDDRKLGERIAERLKRWKSIQSV